MTAETRCRFCGTRIVLDESGPPPGVRALGDSFFHEGCVEGRPTSSDPGVPAYRIPEGW